MNHTRRRITCLLVTALASLGLATNASAQYSPYGQYSPYAESTLQGVVVVNNGNTLVVRTQYVDSAIYVTPYTRVIDQYGSVMSSGSLRTGSEVQIMATATGQMIIASTIIVLSPPVVAYPPLAYPTYIPPFIYRDFVFGWGDFVRRHPGDWRRWQPEWNRHHGDRRDWDRSQGRDRDWDSGR